jgi:hypothetical protein
MIHKCFEFHFEYLAGFLSGWTIFLVEGSKKFKDSMGLRLYIWLLNVTAIDLTVRIEQPALKDKSE